MNLKENTSLSVLLQPNSCRMQSKSKGLAWIEVQTGLLACHAKPVVERNHTAWVGLDS